MDNPPGHEEEIENVYDVIKTAIDSNDILPVVRMVFEEDGEKEAKSVLGSGQMGLASLVQASLENLASEESNIAAKICRANTGAVATSMDELAEMQEAAEHLEHMVVAINGEVQEAGEVLLNQMKEVGELQVVQENLLAAGRALETVCSVLQQLNVACEHLELHRLYQALKIFEEIRRARLDGSLKDMGLSSIQKFLENLIGELTSVVQHLALTDFNDWLVAARAEARQIGLQAIRRAAIQRQQEDKYAQERKAILEQIMTNSDLRQAVALTSLSVPESTASETSSRRTGYPTVEGALDVHGLHDSESWDLATGSMSETAQSASQVGSTGGGLLAAVPEEATSTISDQGGGGRLGMGMHGLHRCVHIHKCLNRLPQFTEHYMQQRRLQMDSDLRPPSNFLETYQTYLSQVTGFFIIEDNVQRMTDDLVHQREVDQLWEVAIATLKGVIDTAFEGMQSAPAMLLVKDFILLVCGALSQSGYPAAPIKDIVSNNTSKYHSLMNTTISNQVLKLWERDDLEVMAIRNEVMQRDIVDLLGLPATLEGLPLTELPYRAPFTNIVPHIMWLVQEYIRDSVSYMTGLLNPGDLLTAACKNRDNVVKVVADVLQSRFATVLSSGESLLNESMQLVSNMWSLTQGLASLEAWTAQEVQGLSVADADLEDAAQAGGGGRKTSAGTSGVTTEFWSVMRGVEDAAEKVVIQLLATKIEEMLAVLRTWDWRPKQAPPAATSPCIEQLMIYLQGVFDVSCKTMPRSSTQTVMVAAMHVVGSCLTHVMTDSTWGINEFGFQRMLGDVTALEKFADRCPIVGLSRDLAPPREVCSLILSMQLDIASEPQKLKRHYPHVEIPMLVSVLDKFRDVGGGYFGGGNAKPQGGLKKRDVEEIARQLRDRMVISSRS
eukprot:evm.model.scf_611.3 EVM.evm.TU.scf_611.3   scf_611:47229-58906(+)